MADQTKIQWADATWNPVTGCTPVSEGCAHCYAERMARRFNLSDLRDGESVSVENYFAPRFHPNRLDIPLHWRKPRRVFVCSMGDLFHEAITDEQIFAIWRVMASSPQHTYIVLTKRPERMREWFRGLDDRGPLDAPPIMWRGTGPYEAGSFGATPNQAKAVVESGRGRMFHAMVDSWGDPPEGCARPVYDWSEGERWWPTVLPNLWLGVTCENQARADERIPILLDTPAAVRFVSCEPLLAGIDLSRYLKGGADRDKQRGCISDGVGPGYVLSRHERAHMASHENGGGEPRGHTIHSGACKDEASGDCAVTRSPAGAVLDARGAHVGLRAPCGVDGREPSGDSERSGDQPQGRRPREQRPGELGAGDETREHAPCRSGAQAFRKEGTGRRAEPLGKGDGGGRQAHSRTVGPEDDDPAADCGGIRPYAERHQLHRAASELGSREVTLDWLILGGETGPGARPMQPQWALDVWRQCKAAGVPFFWKQGSNGIEYDPEMVTTREYPEER